VIEARAALGADLDQLTWSARSSVDIPSKIRKYPLQTAAVAGSAGFLLVGGPKRVLRAAVGRVRPRKRRPHEGLLPDDISKLISKKGGPQSPEIQEALENDFADYLRQKGHEQPASAEQSFWKTYDALIGPLGAVASQQLVRRLFKPTADEPKPDKGPATPPEPPRRGG